MNIWTDIEEKRVTPEHFPVVVEMDSDAGVKYSFDEATGMLFAGKMFASAVSGVSIGFVPCTCAPDGGPLEVLLLCAKPIVPMSLTKAHPIGVLAFENGKEAVVAAPSFDSIYGKTNTIERIDSNVFRSVERFCNLCGNSGAIIRKSGRKDAESIIRTALLRFRNEIDKPERRLH